MTDILEVHFLEIPKLFDEEVERDENDPIVQWMEFLDAKSKGVMEMLAKKNKDIKKAYDLLQIISKDEKSRMLYEARQAEISDQLTRLKSAEAKGMEKGIEKGIEKGKKRNAMENATNFIKLGINEEIVAKGTGLTIEEVIEIKKSMIN